MTARTMSARAPRKTQNGPSCAHEAARDGSISSIAVTFSRPRSQPRIRVIRLCGFRFQHGPGKDRHFNKQKQEHEQYQVPPRILSADGGAGEADFFARANPADVSAGGNLVGLIARE